MFVAACMSQIYAVLYHVLLCLIKRAETNISKQTSDTCVYILQVQMSLLTLISFIIIIIIIIIIDEEILFLHYA